MPLPPAAAPRLSTALPSFSEIMVGELGFSDILLKVVHTAVGRRILAAVPRDCSHSPIVFDLSIVPPVSFSAGSDKSCGWRRCDRRDPLGVFMTPLISGSYFMTCLVLDRAQVCLRI